MAAFTELERDYSGFVRLKRPVTVPALELDQYQHERNHHEEHGLERVFDILEVVNKNIFLGGEHYAYLVLEETELEYIRPDLALGLPYLLLVGRVAEDDEHYYSDKERKEGERPNGVDIFEGTDKDSENPGRITIEIPYNFRHILFIPSFPAQLLYITQRFQAYKIHVVNIRRVIQYNPMPLSSLFPRSCVERFRNVQRRPD